MKNKTLTFAKNYNLFAGTLDSLTGVALIFKPILILYFMGLEEPTENGIFLKFVGVFVLSTGASYFIPNFYKMLGVPYNLLSFVILVVTSITRVLISSFVFSKIFLGELPLPWVIVGLSDLLLAVYQIYLLRNYTNDNDE